MPYKNRNSSVGIAMDYGLIGRGSIPSSGKDCYLYHSVLPHAQNTILPRHLAPNDWWISCSIHQCNKSIKEIKSWTLTLLN
jgi:hypothetical protein